MEKIIGIACDHAGFEMKEFLVGYLMAQGYAVKDYGCNSCDSVDYPVYGHALAKGYENDEYELGIALCGSANGITMTLNKHASIRAAICWRADIAKLARQHNDANICSLPARVISNEEAVEIVDTFLNTDLKGEDTKEE